MISDISAPDASINFVVGRPAPATASAAGSVSPMLKIPDNKAAGGSSTINITQSGIVARIKVSVAIEHPYIGDLRVTLTTPTGRRAVLHAQLGGSNDNLIATYDSASPGVLSGIVGQPMQGAWVLNVADLAKSDIGTFGSGISKSNPAHKRFPSQPELVNRDSLN